MNRRGFIGASIGLTVAGMLPQSLQAKKPNISAEKKSIEIIKPKRLKSGDTIGLVAPAWKLTDNQLENAKKHMETLGFKPYYTSRATGGYGYFGNTDKERAADVNEMFANPDIDGIMCIRGGYGCARILDMIDYDMIRKNPKVFQGYSDITALSNAISQQTGLVTFHGPQATTIYREYNTYQFKNVVMNPSDRYLIENADGDLERAKEHSVSERYTIVAGEASGPLAGGNLMLVTSVVGTPWEVDSKDKIVFFEEVDEEPYRIDGMLTQLINSGKLQQAAGIVFGICIGCERPEKTDAPDSFTLREVIEDRIKPLGIPAAYGLSFGHNIHNFTIPIGINARFNADAMQLELLEKAVK
ncbi:MAG: LD-carboxypeptidase [Prevotellaceae bacterium]|jgi:muramoyltetrapeptide carboxypeptidase|nr:LD-carboxypeptidase [Prevotellaceae bacterium]